MSLKNRLLRRIWWLGWDPREKSSITRRRNVWPGLHTEQMSLSFPFSDRSSLFLLEALECHARINSRVTSSLVSEMRVSWVTLFSSIPSSSRVVHGTKVFGVWIKAEICTGVEQESGAGGPQVQKSSREFQPELPPRSSMVSDKISSYFRKRAGEMKSQRARMHGECALNINLPCGSKELPVFAMH